MTDPTELTQAIGSLVTIVQAGGAVGGAVGLGLFLRWLIPAIRYRGEKAQGSDVHRHLRRLSERMDRQEASQGEAMRQLVRDLQRLTEAVTELTREVAEMRREQAVFQAQQQARQAAAI